MAAPTPSSRTIAVSGHRLLHPDDCARLRAQLAALLTEVALAWSGARLDCLSALAAGADQLFAQEVLALQARFGKEGLRLRVPLPMPEAAYIASQEQPGSTAFRDSFAALRARAQEVFEVPADGGALTGSAPYVRLADYLVAEADLLVALWDGDTGAARQPGGTFDVVMRCLAGPGSGSGSGPAVLHLPVRRAGSAGAAAHLLPALLTVDAGGRLQRTENPQALVRYLAGGRPHTR
jgi:hypothetical protein